MWRKRRLVKRILSCELPREDFSTNATTFYHTRTDVKGICWWVITFMSGDRVTYGRRSRRGPDRLYWLSNDGDNVRSTVGITLIFRRVNGWVRLICSCSQGSPPNPPNWCGGVWGYPATGSPMHDQRALAPHPLWIQPNPHDCLLEIPNS